MSYEPPLLTQLGLLARFASGLRGYLREPATPAACRERIARDLHAREPNFLRMLKLGVFAVPESPYRKLLAHAGMTFDDLGQLVAKRGVDETLETLFDAGVYVHLDEFKGRRPIRRGSLTLPVTTRDFDNPLAVEHIAQQTGGSRSGGTRTRVDLAHCATDAAYECQFLIAFQAWDRPYALWRPPPPWGAGFKAVLRYAKLGKATDRWFAQSPLRYGSRTWKHALLARYAVQASRWHGMPLPMPEHVPLSEPWRVAEWLAAKKQAGTPAVLNTNAASGVRVCLAAKERGLDIAGTLIRVGGEPLTEAKAAAFHQVGCRVVSPFAMGELGLIGMPCAEAEALDDVHLLLDKFALIRRAPRPDAAVTVLANVYTTLLTTTPKLMLNVISDDYGTIEHRTCGCPLGRLGYGLHLHTIRSWEKLTSEGMTFIGSDLVRLVEEVLPGRFGGGPLDYQFVEEEEAGLPKVNLLISPSVGPVDERAVVDAVVHFLNTIPGASDNYGERWREGRTLRVVRQEPYATAASKVLALHTLKPKAERSVAARV